MRALSLPRTSPSTARSRCWETGSTPGQGDQSDLLEELHRQDRRSDAFLTGRKPSKICAATGPSSRTTPVASQSI